MLRLSLLCRRPHVSSDAPEVVPRATHLPILTPPGPRRYPLQAHPARKCALSLYAAVALGKDPDTGVPEVPGIVPFYAITAAFVLGSYGVAMAVTDLGIVLAMVGATGSTMVSYILPGAIYYKLHPNGGLLQRLAAMQFIIGCCIVPVALWGIFQ